MRKCILLVALLSLLAGQATAGTITLDFDSLPTGIITPFTQDGYEITWGNYPDGTYAQAIENVGGTNQNVVVDGTPSNVFGSGLIITRIDGGVFDLISLDIADLSYCTRIDDL